jgi:hypothetical protein
MAGQTISLAGAKRSGQNSGLRRSSEFSAYFEGVTPKPGAVQPGEELALSEAEGISRGEEIAGRERRFPQNRNRYETFTKNCRLSFMKSFRVVSSPVGVGMSRRSRFWRLLLYPT